MGEVFLLGFTAVATEIKPVVLTEGQTHLIFDTGAKTIQQMVLEQLTSIDKETWT